MDQVELASAASWLHWLTAIKYVGGALVVIGVAAELLGDWFSEPLQKKLDDARKLEIVQLTNEGQRLSKEAELLKNKNLSLQKALAPRLLEQKETAVPLKPFSDVTFTVVSVPDPEARRLAGQIRVLLDMAGWKEIPKETAATLPAPFFFDGVLVWWGKPPDTVPPGNPLLRPAQALIQQLQANEIKSGMGGGIPELYPLNGIRIVVGFKPMPDFKDLVQERLKGLSDPDHAVFGNSRE